MHTAEDVIHGEGYIDPNIPYTQTANLPSVLNLKLNIPVMITVNSTTKRFKENGIVNGARGFIEGLEFTTRKDGTKRLNIIWVVFPEKETGALLRDAMKAKGIKHNNSKAVPIMQMSKSFQIKGTNTKAKRKQFPLVICFCMTSYKSQGQTLEAVILDYLNCRGKHGQFYVGMTRIRNGDGLFVRNFHPSQIHCRRDVITEIRRLVTARKYKFYSFFLREKIWENDENEWKIGYQNTNGFYHNLENIDNDKNLSELHFLCISETKLAPDVSTESLNMRMNNFEILYRTDVVNENNTPHMGMLLLQNKRCKDIEYIISPELLRLHGKKIQWIKFNIDNDFTVLFVYINKTPEMYEVQEFSRLIAQENAMSVLGDFNLNIDKKEDAAKIFTLVKRTNMSLEGNEKTRMNSSLDIVMKKIGESQEFVSFAYRNLYSDHATVGFRCCNNGIISEEYRNLQILKQNKSFLQKITLSDNNIVPVEEETAKESIAVENNEDKIVISNRAAVIRESDLKRLENHEWLTDEVINFYLDMLANKFKNVFRFPTNFHDILKNAGFEHMKRRFISIPMFDYPLWLVPVNFKNVHWFLLVIDLQEINEGDVIIKAYDSLEENNLKNLEIGEKSLSDFINWRYEQETNNRSCVLREAYFKKST